MDHLEPTVECVQESSILKVEIQKNPSGVRVAFVGRIDEQAELQETWNKLLSHSGQTRSVHFDLSRVNAINSVGVKNWLMFIQRVESTFQFEFEVIGEIFAELGGFIQNVFGVAPPAIRNLMVPYVCRKCQRQQLRKLGQEELEVAAEGYLAPKAHCEFCRSEMEFDGIEREYFHFLDTIAQHTNPA